MDKEKLKLSKSEWAGLIFVAASILLGVLLTCGVVVVPS